MPATICAARAYPRSRGATDCWDAAQERRTGLSPLTRGNRDVSGPGRAAVGPIPAHAGQPLRAGCRCPACRAYPRSRGATGHRGRQARLPSGLSPLTRGNRLSHFMACPPAGPIPAHAGQPSSTTALLACVRAYPRSRGATACTCGPDHRLQGLSPLTRGNRTRRHSTGLGVGPIPAHAGQPGRPAVSRSRRRAYPRSRGATALRRSRRDWSLGLSPLTRGNLGAILAGALEHGPIPAHAGQPISISGRSWASRAYPRSRGATGARLQDGCRVWGLSPLTRGNHARVPHAPRRRGPIPAHAGQPAAQHVISFIERAYPRSRGATENMNRIDGLDEGLSPLTRGNPGAALAGPGRPGPIPAHAGQPSASTSSPSWPGAYPRSRGATRRASQSEPAM